MYYSILALPIMKRLPTNHAFQMFAGFAILVLAFIAYYFAPPDKAAFFMAQGGLASGFLFGKFTNGFGSRSKDE